MRLGGRVFMDTINPETWIKKLKESGYTAAFCPIDGKASDSLIADYKKAADENNIVIAETGAWSNPISPNEKERLQAVRLCKNQLALAEKIGARCCVNISGSRSSTIVSKASGCAP